MRAIVVVTCFGLAACGGSGGDDSAQCGSDSDCSGGDICARDESCWPADDVRSVKVTWTINGQTASATTCAQFPDLFVNFGSQQAVFGFAPVPCMAGEFPIDKLPTVYTQVEVGDQTDEYFDQVMPIDESGMAAFDLVP